MSQHPKRAANPVVEFDGGTPDLRPPPAPTTEQLRTLGYPVIDGCVTMPPSARYPRTPPAPEDQFEALRAMTGRQRVAAMYEGRLTIQQLSRWAAMAPQEVAVVDGEFIYVTAQLADYDTDEVPTGTRRGRTSA